MKRALPMFAALALAACATTSPPPPPPPPGPTAAIGQLADAGGLRLRPLELSEDSRCPAQVQCVWAGRVRIIAEVERPGGGELVNTGLTLGEPVAIYGGRLTLVAVQPDKGFPGSIAPERYRFTFTFVR